MCAPGVEQTERIRQQWSLLTPKLQEQISLPYRGSHRERNCDSPATYIYNSWSFSALQMLSGAVAERISTESFTPPVAVAKLSPIERLPAEVLMMFLEYNLEKQDIVALGICSSTLWMYVLRHVARALRKTLSDWRGSPLVCTGTYLTDFPPVIQHLISVYTEQEQLHQERTRHHQKGMPRLRNNMAPARRYDWDARSSFKHIPDREYEIHTWLSAFTYVYNENESVRMALQSSLKQALQSRNGDQSGSWVLQNLTSKEFVMLDVKDNGIENPEVMVKDAPWLNLDHALLQRICWSRYDGDLYENDEEKKIQKRCHRGAWAGHAFRVIRGGDFCPDGWQDVTAAIAGEAEVAVARRFEISSQGEEGDED